MKDITHYFSGLSSKTSEITKMDCSVEVKSLRGKRSPKKRERVKIRITSAKSGSVKCKLVENKLDLIDKTPSPLCNGQRTASRHNDETPLGKKRLVDEDGLIVVKQSKENIADVVNCTDKECIDIHDVDDKDTIKTQKISKLQNKKKNEKVIALANKKGFEEKKRKEKIEEIEIDNIIQEKKKLFMQESKKNYSNNENDLNSQKRSFCSLLNYFSRATPEQLQQKKMASSTVVVKAEVHQTDESKGKLKSQTISPMTPKTKMKRKKRLSNAETILSHADEIEVISSENISSPPTFVTNQELTPKRNDSSINMNTTPKINKTPKNKPKWSMKIKLNSLEDGNNDNVSKDTECLSDEELFTPRSQKKFENKEKSRDQIKIQHNKSTPKKENCIKCSSELQSDKNETSSNSTKFESSVAKEEKSLSLSPKETKSGCLVKSPLNTTTTVEKLAPIFMRRNPSKENGIVEESLKRKPTEKLASLFIKRPRPDPEVLAARRRFLQPEVVDLTERPKTPVLLDPVYFPKISHVTQLENSEENAKCELKFSLKPTSDYENILNIEEMKCLNSSQEIHNITETKLETITEEEAQSIIKEMEVRCKSATKIWSRVLHFYKQNEHKPAEVKKKKRGRPKKNSLTTNDTLIEEENILTDVVWTTKYKPTCSDEVIGNEIAVEKLKHWLDNWKSMSDNKDKSDSEDDFYSSDCSRSSFTTKKQVALLVGPYGCGKTSSVYAIAEELGYKVIEVNASSKRPGKKILKDLEEATKSHRIRNHSMESFGFGVNTNSADNKLIIAKKSLILLDDVDLVFEEDDGFMNAAFQLALNSKRPIAMTCKNSVSHLNKYSLQILKINFQPICSKLVSTFLEMVSLAETRYKLPNSCAEALAITGDLRKALLQLQYLLLSGQMPSTSNIENTRPSIWKDTYKGLYRPIIKATRSNKKKLLQDQKDEEKSASSAPTTSDSIFLQNMANKIDNLSLISNLSLQTDVAFQPKQQLLEDSLSLVEKLNHYSYSDQLGSEIYDWITEKTLGKSEPLESKDIAHMNDILVRKNTNEVVNTALTHTIAWTLDRRAISTDYLPYVRAICRAEEIRKNYNVKRSNRFYHYLQGIVTVPSHSFICTIPAACKMFQEKVKDKT